MRRAILAINAGSSSLKFALFEAGAPDKLQEIACYSRGAGEIDVAADRQLDGSKVRSEIAALDEQANESSATLISVPSSLIILERRRTYEELVIARRVAQQLSSGRCSRAYD